MRPLNMYSFVFLVFSSYILLMEASLQKSVGVPGIPQTINQNNIAKYSEVKKRDRSEVHKLRGISSGLIKRTRKGKVALFQNVYPVGTKWLVDTGWRNKRSTDNKDNGENIRSSYLETDKYNRTANGDSNSFSRLPQNVAKNDQSQDPNRTRKNMKREKSTKSDSVTPAQSDSALDTLPDVEDGRSEKYGEKSFSHTHTDVDEKSFKSRLEDLYREFIMRKNRLSWAFQFLEDAEESQEESQKSSSASTNVTGFHTGTSRDGGDSYETSNVNDMTVTSSPLPLNASDVTESYFENMNNSTILSAHPEHDNSNASLLQSPLSGASHASLTPARNEGSHNQEEYRHGSHNYRYDNEQNVDENEENNDSNVSVNVESQQTDSQDRVNDTSINNSQDASNNTRSNSSHDRDNDTKQIDWLEGTNDTKHNDSQEITNDTKQILHDSVPMLSALHNEDIETVENSSQARASNAEKPEKEEAERPKEDRHNDKDNVYSSECPNCGDMEKDVKLLRLKIFKNLLVQKLRLDPRERSKSHGRTEDRVPKLPDAIVEQTLKDNAREIEKDEFHARDQELIIAGEDMGQDCVKMQATGCYTFNLKARIKGEVAEAHLWVYKMKDTNDVSEQTFNVYELERLKSGRLAHSSMLVSAGSSVGEGWVVLNVTRPVTKWAQKRKGSEMLAIRCATCSTRSHRALYGAKLDYKPLLVIKYDTHNYASRHKRSQTCDPRYECCKRDLVVNFQNIGMSDIMQPRHLAVGYCYGECNEIHHYHYNHTFVRQRARWSEPLADQHTMRQQLKPCCAPLVLKDIFIMTSEGDGTMVRKLLPKVIVESCGCI